MHYPFADGRGCDASRGCLRVVPGSHRWSRERDAEFCELAAELRRQQGLPSEYGELAALYPTSADVHVPGEVTLALGAADLLLRKGTIYHCTHENHQLEGRLMQHWLFRGADHSPSNHRFRWEEYLSHALIDQLSEAQRQVLWIGRGQKLDERYSKERSRELGRVIWGTLGFRARPQVAKL
jgi:hypothetical protein